MLPIIYFLAFPDIVRELLRVVAYLNVPVHKRVINAQHFTITLKGCSQGVVMAQCAEPTAYDKDIALHDLSRVSILF